MPATPHIEKHFMASESVHDVVIGIKSLRQKTSTSILPNWTRSSLSRAAVMPNPQIALFAALQRCPATPSRPLAPETSNFFGTMLL